MVKHFKTEYIRNYTNTYLTTQKFNYQAANVKHLNLQLTIVRWYCDLENMFSLNSLQKYLHNGFGALNKIYQHLHFLLFNLYYIMFADINKNKTFLF